MSVVSGNKVLYSGQELVVVDVSPFERDPSLDRVVLRPLNDPDGEFTVTHPDSVTVIGHIDPYDNWVEDPRGSGNWRQT